MPSSNGSQNGASLFLGSAQVSCHIARAPTQFEATGFLECWREEAATGDIVIGRDIPSRPFAKFLTHLMLAEPIEDESDCHIRFAGTLLHRYFGRDVTGERLSDLYPLPVFVQHCSAMRNVRQSGVPVTLTGTIASELLPVRGFEVVILRARAPDDIAIWNVIGIFVSTG